ncbi:Lysophospholipase L1 [Planctomicrobium piriforme]|uniref:Lysophospholipase L1 n=2 Tax=Planctomicrobium piriforme TaxID=1576369 RepID=A0A1I3B8K6_9PLAN|nr:Lysophospholipase L1 [Planctomicrobium piriforme]
MPYLIRAVGDCNTKAGAGLPRSEAFPAKLLDFLQGLGLHCELDNLGATMNTSREGVARLADCATPADLLLLNFGLVDSWVTSIPWLYISYYPENILKKPARKLLKNFKRRLRSPRLRELVGVGPVVPVEEYRRNLQQMIATERSRNPSVQVVLWGSVMTRHSPERDVRLQSYNQVLQEIAAEASCVYFDAAPVVRRWPAERIYVDDVHLSGEAAALLARELLPELTLPLLADQRSAA